MPAEKRETSGAQPGRSGQPRVAGAPLVARSLAHEAKYSIVPGDLARLLGITVPEGGTVTVEHVNRALGRTTDIPDGHLLVIRVSWTGEEQS